MRIQLSGPLFVAATTAGLLLGQTKVTVTKAGSGASKWVAAKTVWGDPDLQGVWTSDDLHDVPLERPAKFGTRRFLTEDELADRMKNLDSYATAAETGDRPKTGFWATQKGVDAEAVPAQWVEYAKHASR